MDLVDLRQILHESPRPSGRDPPQNIALNLQLRTHKTFVLGAAIRLHQIINNLLSNAIKSTPGKGQITIELQDNNRRLRLSIADTGGGIEPENLEKIFQPFEQCNRRQEDARGGLGLGLTIAKTLANLMAVVSSRKAKAPAVALLLSSSCP